MDIFEFISKIIEASIWPLVTLFIVLSFRKRLLGLFDRIGTIKIKDVELSLAKDLKNAETKAQDLNLPTARGIKKLPEKLPPTSIYDRQIWLATHFPNAAVMDSWRTVEFATADVAEALEIEFPGQIAGERVIKEIFELKEISGNLIGLYRDLRTMRNKVAHQRDAEIDPSEAIRFVELALSLVNELEEIAQSQNNEK